MIFIIIVLLIAVIVLSMVLFFTFKNIKEATEALSKIDTEDTNAKLRLSVPEKSMENLLNEINIMISLRQEEGIMYQRKEKELRSQIANISHDLRTPLTSILGYIELINDGDTTEEEKHEYLEIIEKRSKVLQTLITSFYDLSRLDANEYAFSFENVNVESILRELVASFYGDFSDRGFKINVSMEEGLPQVIADRNAVIRVYTNIIQNALKHGSNIINFEQFKEGEFIVSRISNGVDSFDVADVEHVFDRFFTKDRMRTGQNTGLGLSIVKRLVEEMGHIVTASYEDKLFMIEIRWKLRN